VYELEVTAAQYLVRQELRAAQCHLAAHINAVVTGERFLANARIRLRRAQLAYEFCHPRVAA
jgi:hypothetical protein